MTSKERRLRSQAIGWPIKDDLNLISDVAFSIASPFAGKEVAQDNTPRIYEENAGKYV